MKRFVCILLVLITLFSLVSCAESPIKKSEKVKFRADEKWALVNGGSILEISLKDNIPYLTYLGTITGEKNMFAEASQMFLPYSYKIEEASQSFNWVYKEAIEEDNLLTLIFNDDAGFEYNLLCEYTPESDGPFQISGKLLNLSGKDISYTSLNLFNTYLSMPEETTAWTFKKESGCAEGATLYNGTHYEGTGIYKTVLKEKTNVRINTNPGNGWNTNGYIPMMYLDSNSNCGVYAALEWPDAKIEAYGKGNNEVELAINITEHGSFATKIPEGDTFVIPTAYFGVYDGDVDEGGNVFKRWFFNYKSPESMRENEMEPLTQMDMQIGLDAAELGLQSIKWDYGWWSSEKAKDPTDPTITWTWKTLEGAWEVREPAYLNVLRSYRCETIKDFTDLAKEKGLTLAIYVLLHDSYEDIDFGLTSHEGHGKKEWFGPTQITTGKSADLGNEECVEFLKSELKEFFVSSGATTWRSDFEPISIYSDRANRHYANGYDVTYWCATGFYDLVDHLIETVPGFRYESCCSGGAMKDFATLTRASVINNDDSADYTSLRMTFYDSSYCIPAAQLQSPCNIDTFKDGSIYRTGTGDTDFGMRSIMMGAVMLSSWTVDIDRDVYARYCTMYNEKIKPLVREADLYHVLPRPDGINWDGIQYADKDSENEIKGCLFVYKPTNNEGETKNIKLRGLYEDRDYILTSEDSRFEPVTVNGKVLMEEGFDMTIKGDMGSDILWITEK